MIATVNTIAELSSELKRRCGRLGKVLDIGCGIRPFSWLKSDLLVCVEPFDPYRKMLGSSFGREGLVSMKGDLRTVVSLTDIADYDLVTMIDVIEHIAKKEGREALEKIINSGAELIMVFTPNGFMPQHAETEDAWGFNSGTQQEHLSGWTKEDFDELGFTSYISVNHLHYENGEYWDGLLAIRDVRTKRARCLRLWDPREYPNSPPKDCSWVCVLGRHSRISGTVIGTHQTSMSKKFYIPALSFAPKVVQRLYKSFIKRVIALINWILN